MNQQHLISMQVASTILGGVALMAGMILRGPLHVAMGSFFRGAAAGIFLCLFLISVTAGGMK